MKLHFSISPTDTLIEHWEIKYNTIIMKKAINLERRGMGARVRRQEGGSKHKILKFLIKS